MEILPYGNHGILLSLGNEINTASNQRIHHIHEGLKMMNLDGLRYSIPAYTSLTISYHPEIISFEQIREYIIQLSEQELVSPTTARRLKIPVCYGGDYGPDLSEFAKEKSLDEEDIINLHISRDYHVYMMGFLPGFVYLGGLPPTLSAKRKSTPRLKVEPGSVGLAGMQTGIYPVESPGGWQILGKTPVRIFQPEREEPFLFKNGDHIKFYSIHSEEFRDWVLRNPSREELYG